MKKQQLVIISILFGFSGFAALTYQVTWIRELGSFFGIQDYAGDVFEADRNRGNVLNAIESRQRELANRLGVYIEQID